MRAQEGATTAESRDMDTMALQHQVPPYQRVSRTLTDITKVEPRAKKKEKTPVPQNPLESGGQSSKRPA